MTQASWLVRAVTRRRNSSLGRGSQPGWWKALSSSRCGTSRLSASSLATVDLPEPEFPTTDTRRTNADHSTVRRRPANRFPQHRLGVGRNSLPTELRERKSLSTGGGQFRRDITGRELVKRRRGVIGHRERAPPGGVPSGV